MPPKRKAASKKDKKKRQEAETIDSTTPVEDEPHAPPAVQEADPITTANPPVPEPPSDDRSPDLHQETPADAHTPSNKGEDEPMDVDTKPNEPSMTMEERRAKLQQLRQKMNSTLQANRKDLVEDSAKHKTSIREQARLEKQQRLAEVLRQRIDAEEAGEDLERKKNWEYSVEENDEWEKRQARKKRRSNFEFNDYEDAARRRYKKDVDLLKPDLEAYQKQKAVASGSSSSALTAAEDLYRDANTLNYADHKPSEEAIDRVAAKLNSDIDRRRNFSKTRVNEKEGDITYINEANRIERYYNKYTAEIRANFERGTAL
ncbi:hypothetical protein FRB99_002702 [Tulasnella sp. 403]|nr:hypothetical protein FRB99_002702 [Tulasnella sp. 403]